MAIADNHQDMDARLAIEGIQCYAFHGCLPEERKIGGRVSVDVYFIMDRRKSFIHDNLEDTVDYQKVHDIVNKEMAIPSNLIEHVCHRLLQTLSNSTTGYKSLSVRVTKYNPPVNGEIRNASIVLSRAHADSSLAGQ